MVSPVKYDLKSVIQILSIVPQEALKTRGWGL